MSDVKRIIGNPSYEAFEKLLSYWWGKEDKAVASQLEKHVSDGVANLIKAIEKIDLDIVGEKLPPNEKKELTNKIYELIMLHYVQSAEKHKHASAVKLVTIAKRIGV